MYCTQMKDEFGSAKRSRSKSAGLEGNPVPAANAALKGERMVWEKGKEEMESKSF